MAATRTRVTGPVVLPNGSNAPDGAVIIFSLPDWDKDGTTVVMDGPAEAVVSGGAIDIDLWRTTAGGRALSYDVAYRYFNEPAQRWITKPLGRVALSGAGPVTLAAILSTPAPVPNVPDALAQALGAAAEAEAQRLAAEAARDQAEGATALGGWFDTIDEGRAAVANNVQFGVRAGGTDGLIRPTIYRRDSSSTQTLIVELPRGTEIDGLAKSVDAIQVGESTDLVLVVYDRRGNRLPFGLRRSDGKVDDLTLSALLERVAEHHEVPSVRDVPGYSLALYDARGTMLWGSLRETDGEWPDWTIRRLTERQIEGGWLPITDPSDWSEPQAQTAAARVSPYVVGPRDWLVGRGEVLTYSADARPPRFHLKSGKLREVDTDLRRIVTIGSSTLGNMASALNTMAAGIRTVKGEVVTFTGFAKGGERAGDSCARLGVIPALITIADGMAPASGAVNVSATVVTPTTSLLAYVGYLGDSDVEFTLSYNGTTFVLTRSVAGAAFAVPAGTPFYPKVGPDHLRKFAIINTGKNDLTAGASAASVIEKVDRIIDSLMGQDMRFILIDQFVNRGTIANSAVREQIQIMNAYYRRKIGPQHVSVADFLAHTDFWTWLSVADPSFTEPTADDLAQRALGNLAPSQGLDSAHMSVVTQQMFIDRYLKPKLIELGYYTGA